MKYSLGKNLSLSIICLLKFWEILHPPKGDPMFELKKLPDTLKYAYLDEKKIYPVIINSNLLVHEEKRLLKTLKKHHATI